MNKTEYDTYLNKIKCIRDSYRRIYAQRKGSLVFDGIVNYEQYKNILIFLKEANQDGSDLSEPKPLNDLLNENEPWEMWHRVAEWIWGITNVTLDSYLPYSSLLSLNNAEKHKLIKKIAVINVNKADGTGSPKQNDINKRLKEALESHPNELKAEIDATMPRVIICGNTYEYLRKLYNLPSCDGYKGFTRSDIGNNKDVLIINSCHPNAHVLSLMTYYGIVGVFSEALSEGWNW